MTYLHITAIRSTLCRFFPNVICKKTSVTSGILFYISIVFLISNAVYLTAILLWFWTFIKWDFSNHSNYDQIYQNNICSYFKTFRKTDICRSYTSLIALVAKQILSYAAEKSKFSFVKIFSHFDVVSPLAYNWITIPLYFLYRNPHHLSSFQNIVLLYLFSSAQEKQALSLSPWQIYVDKSIHYIPVRQPVKLFWTIRLSNLIILAMCQAHLIG